MNEEMTDHLGHEKNRVPEGRESTNVRNGTRPKTVLTHATGQVDLEVPRDRDGTFEPVIVKKRQRRLGEVEEISAHNACDLRCLGAEGDDQPDY